MMSVKFIAIIFLQGIYFGFSFKLLGGTKDANPLCCIPDEWEGMIFGEEGATFLDLNAGLNGTVHLVYSWPRKQVYYEFHLVAQVPGIGPVASNSTEFGDYAGGMYYTVESDGSCTKVLIGHDMPRQCIPSDAKLLSSGVFGDEIPVKTYHFISTEDDNATATVYIDDTVTPPQCQPIQLTLTLSGVIPGDITVTNFNVMDIGPITSKDVFKIPDACK